jgi:hypothetical protein
MWFLKLQLDQNLVVVYHKFNSDFKSHINFRMTKNRHKGDNITLTDDAFEGMSLLDKVFLANNEFRGKMPSSIASLHMLVLLGLGGNKFEGQIPDFQHKDLNKLNVSSNDLKGPTLPA